MFVAIHKNGTSKMHILSVAIEPSKEERIQSVLPIQYGPLVCLMLSSAIEVANSVVAK